MKFGVPALEAAEEEGVGGGRVDCGAAAAAEEEERGGDEVRDDEGLEGGEVRFSETGYVVIRLETERDWRVNSGEECLGAIRGPDRELPVPD